MPDFYTGSDGKTVDITTLHPARLKNAVAKMERMGETDDPQYPAMKKLAEEQAEEWAQQEAEAQRR